MIIFFDQIALKNVGRMNQMQFTITMGNNLSDDDIGYIGEPINSDLCGT